MLNLKPIFILLFLGVLAVSVLTDKLARAENSQITPKAEITSRIMDPRAQILQAYLGRYNSPLQYQAQDFIDAADQYDLDWRLVAAISGVESTFGKFIPGGYNAWGWGVYGTQAIYFKSWRDGIFTVSEGLKTKYYDQGLTNPYTINKVYAASPAWGTKVTYFLNDLEKFKTQYETTKGLTNVSNYNLKTAGTSALLASR